MDEQLDNRQADIVSKWQDQRPLLELDYPFGEMGQPHIAKLLSEQLIQKYKELKSKPVDGAKRNVCILVIKAAVAGSSLVRALFDLYKVVSADSAKLICVSYPEDYMDSLTSLGLTALPGFKLTNSLGEALALADTM